MSTGTMKESYLLHLPMKDSCMLLPIEQPREGLPMRPRQLTSNPGTVAEPTVSGPNQDVTSANVHQA